MNVIFLDIDGVLNCADSFTPSAYHPCWVIDPDLVSQLNHIIKNVDNLTVVLSSSWRYAVRSGHIDIDELLREQDYKGDPITERTVCGYEDDKPRGLEIQKWLDNHPEVENFVILDDNDDMVHLTPDLVQTSFNEGGLTKELADETIRRLTSSN